VCGRQVHNVYLQKILVTFNRLWIESITLFRIGSLLLKRQSNVVRTVLLSTVLLEFVTALLEYLNL